MRRRIFEFNIYFFLTQVENTRKLFRSQDAQQHQVEAESSGSQGGPKNAKAKPSKSLLAMDLMKSAVKPSTSRTK